MSESKKEERCKALFMQLLDDINQYGFVEANAQCKINYTHGTEIVPRRYNFIDTINATKSRIKERAIKRFSTGYGYTIPIEKESLLQKIGTNIADIPSKIFQKYEFAMHCCLDKIYGTVENIPEELKAFFSEAMMRRKAYDLAYQELDNYLKNDAPGVYQAIDSHLSKNASAQPLKAAAQGIMQEVRAFSQVMEYQKLPELTNLLDKTLIAVKAPSPKNSQACLDAGQKIQQYHGGKKLSAMVTIFVAVILIAAAATVLGLTAGAMLPVNFVIVQSLLAIRAAYLDIYHAKKDSAAYVQNVNALSAGSTDPNGDGGSIGEQKRLLPGSLSGSP